MSKENCDRLRVIDHANKLADRERVNPNRARKKFVRDLKDLSGPDWVCEGTKNRAK